MKYATNNQWKGELGKLLCTKAEVALILGISVEQASSLLSEMWWTSLYDDFESDDYFMSLGKEDFLKLREMSKKLFS